jgi:hypothetical protein
MKFLRENIFTIIIFFTVSIACGVLLFYVGQFDKDRQSKRLLDLQIKVNNCYAENGIWVKIGYRDYMCVFPESESLK